MRRSPEDVPDDATSRAAPAHVRAEALRTPGWFGVLATAFWVALGFGLVVPALPIFARELGASYSATSAVVAVFAGIRLLSSTPAGAAVDRVGARVVVVAGLVVVAISSALTADAGSLGALIGLRGMGGVGSAMFTVGLGQHIVLTIPRAQRGRANGMLQGAFLLGGASGPAVGGVVIDVLGVRAPFVIYAVALLVSAGIAWRFLKDAERPPGGRPTGHVSAAALREVLRDPALWAALTMALALNWATQGLRFFSIPVFSEEVLGLSGSRIGLALTVAAVAHGIVLWPAARLMDSRGRRLNARVGMALYAVAVFGLTTVTGFDGLVAWMLLQGIATGVGSSVPSAVVGDIAPPDAAGRTVGVLGVARDVGAVVGVQASGMLTDAYGFGPSFAVAGALLVIAFIASLTLRETLHHAGAAPASGPA